MSLNTQIIDLQVTGLLDRQRSALERKLGTTENEQLRSAAFVVLCAKVMLDVSEEDAVDLLTDGGNDLAIDALHISEAKDQTVEVTLFQGKYHRDLARAHERHFPGNAITQMIAAVATIFDPHRPYTANALLRLRVEELRQLLLEGNIPVIRVLACSNGAGLTQVSREEADAAPLGSRVEWVHIGTETVVGILQRAEVVNDQLHLSGPATSEAFNYKQVIIGRVHVREIQRLFNTHGEKLLDRNVRRYLGLNRVNDDIRRTLMDPEDQGNFYFYNNGITIICDDFTHPDLQRRDWVVNLRDLQVVNGGQTCRTIQETLNADSNADLDASVLVRIYKVPKEQQDMVQRITLATNSQNPVDLRDLRSNDENQRRIALSVEPLGYTYQSKRGENGKKNEISSYGAAEAVLAVWRQRPHQAKYYSRDFFNKFYADIFTPGLNGAQVVVAWTIFRAAERLRKNWDSSLPEFAYYATCYTAMLEGHYLLRDMGVDLAGLDHRNFQQAMDRWNADQATYQQAAIAAIERALTQTHPGGLATVSMQQLAATFRRYDLIDILRQQGALAQPGLRAAN